MMHAGNSPWWAVLALAAAVTVWPQPAAGGEATEAVHLTDTDSDEIAAPPAAAEQAEEAAEDEAEAHAAAGDSHGVATAGPESAEDATEEEKPAGIDLNRMLREVEALKRYADAEAEAALAELSRDRAHLTAAVADLRARRAALMAEVDSLQKRYSRQIRRLRQLDALEKEDSASRKALEGAARQAAATVRDRLTRSLYTSQAPEMLDAATAIAASPSFPDLGEVTTLTGVLFQELKLSGTISILPDSISLPDGTTAEGRVLRVGGMLAAAAFGDGDYAFAQPVGDGRRLMTVQADVPASAVRLIEQAFTPGATAFPADFSDGGVYRRFVAGRTFWEHILAGGVLIWPIIGLGIFAFLLGLFRYLRLLLVRFGSSRVLDQFFALAREQKLDEARDLLGRQKTRRVPVYRVLTHMLDEWNEAGIASLEKCRDEAILNTMAPLERGISFVAVAAAIAPLLGLLGTVTGMISTFDVITIFGNSDPKLLSGGISVALVTTELGLIAAIPLMFLHFFLSRRVATLVNDMEEKGAVLIARVSAGGADAGAAP